ncbi:MAG: flavodoxin domain-containing protein [Candidatus Bathyarchaeota archaeon]|nr:flavodoxin domain-containing protein [Candidatus Bathyarchaeota archaeon]
MYFSRTGNTKRMAEAIAESIKAPVFAITSSEPAIVEDFDVLILGTPVEGFRPAREMMAFVERLMKTEGKKAILFCTYKLWKGSVFKILEKKLAEKGYRVILSVSKKGIKLDKPTEFSGCINKILEALKK